MSADDNLETVKFLYDVFGRGDVGAILDRGTEDTALTAATLQA